VLEDDEPPRLAVLRATGDASGVEDAPDDVLGDRTAVVVPLVAFAGDGEKRVQVESLSARFARSRRGLAA
jgi:hypothetical protein